MAVQANINLDIGGKYAFLRDYFHDYFYVQMKYVVRSGKFFWQAKKFNKLTKSLNLLPHIPCE